MIEFFVAGTPKTLSVGKTVRYQRGPQTFQHQTRRNTEWSDVFAAISRQHAPEKLMEGAVGLGLVFKMRRPKSARRAKYPLTRPDIDNLINKLTDRLNGVYWIDDNQVVFMTVAKQFADANGPTGLQVAIEELSE